MPLPDEDGRPAPPLCPICGKPAIDTHLSINGYAMHGACAKRIDGGRAEEEALRAALRQAIKQCALHNSEYHHVTPEPLLTQWEALLSGSGALLMAETPTPKPPRPSLRMVCNVAALREPPHHYPGTSPCLLPFVESLAAMLILNRYWQPGRFSLSSIDGQVVASCDGSPVAALPLEEWRSKVDDFARRAAGVAEGGPIPVEVLIEIWASSVPAVR